MVKGNKLIDDHRQIAVNLLKLKTHGKTFEVAIDPDKAVAYKQGDTSIDIDEIIQADHVFTDMKKGMVASDDDLEAVFGTTQTQEIVKVMFAKGEIQFTQKYREQLMEQKEKQILTYIQRHAINPQTNLPHPLTRIKAAIEEAKVRIDPMQQVDKQAKEIVKALQPVLPIKIAEIIFIVHVPAQYAARSRGILGEQGAVQHETWNSDGSLTCELRIPAGVQETCIRTLNNITQGTVDIQVKK